MIFSIVQKGFETNRKSAIECRSNILDFEIIEYDWHAELLKNGCVLPCTVQIIFFIFRASYYHFATFEQQSRRSRISDPHYHSMESGRIIFGISHTVCDFKLQVDTR